MLIDLWLWLLLFSWISFLLSILKFFVRFTVEELEYMQSDWLEFRAFFFFALKFSKCIETNAI